MVVQQGGNMKVIFEDNHLLVVEKPINIPTQEDSSGDKDFLTILKEYIKEKYNKPGNVYLGLVHRLDRVVGGVMVFAKTSKCASRLSEQVRSHTFKKTYHAVVEGNIDNSGTFKDNLLKAKKNADEEEIKRALKIAQAYEFVSNFDDGVNHTIYQGAKNISGGQKQRLSIARAIIKNAPILILDDSSSALDYQTEASLRHELQTLKQTTIIISQRAISLMHADKILVMEKGHLTDIGSHAYLYKHSKLYHEICTSQDVGEKANV